MTKEYKELLRTPEGHSLALTGSELFEDGNYVGTVHWMDEIDEGQEVVDTHKVFDGFAKASPADPVVRVQY